MLQCCSLYAFLLRAALSNTHSDTFSLSLSHTLLLSAFITFSANCAVNLGLIKWDGSCAAFKLHSSLIFLLLFSLALPFLLHFCFALTFLSWRSTGERVLLLYCDRTKTDWAAAPAKLLLELRKVPMRRFGSRSNWRSQACQSFWAFIRAGRQSFSNELWTSSRERERSAVGFKRAALPDQGNGVRERELKRARHSAALKFMKLATLPE